MLPADRNGLPDHDKYVPVTEQNLDLVREARARAQGVRLRVLFGQDSVFSTGEMGEIERSVVESEGLKLQDFKVPEIPECNSRGSRRELLAHYKDLDAEGRRGRAGCVLHIRQGLLRHRSLARVHEVRHARLLILRVG